MKTIINIGLLKGPRRNLIGVEMDKPFNELNMSDVLLAARKKLKLPENEPLHIIGWADRTDYRIIE